MNSKVKGAILTTVLMSLSITGCSLAGKGGEADRNKVVAEVNNETILKGELLDLYELQKSYYGITDEIEADSKNEQNIKNVKLSVLENLIYQKVIMQKAKEAGFDITDEDLQKAREELNEIIAETAEELKEQDGSNASDDTDYTKKAQESINSQLESMGVTQDEYIKLRAQDMVMTEFMNKTTENVEVTDEDIKEYYDTELAAQKKDISSISNSYVQLYEPEAVVVKHILIQIPEEQQKEYKNLVNEGKEEEAKAYLDEQLKAIQPKAQQVLDKAKNGENFEDLIDEYGEDPGMNLSPDGYTVRRDGQFVESFETASFELQKGEISGLVASTYGYHIIKAYDRVPEKVYSLEERIEEIREAVEYEKKNDLWEAAIEQWMSEATINKFEDRI